MTPRSSAPAPTERRSISCTFRDVNVEAKADDDAMRFSGYGAYFSNLDSYGDAIAPGAFKRTLREAKKSGLWPSMLSQHGGWGITSTDMTPVGLWEALDEDDKGLFAKGVLAPTPRGEELYALLKMKPRPAISGLSIGFIPVKWKTNSAPKDGEPRRTLTDVDLLEISPVTWPANALARITSVKAACGSARDIEALFREVCGLSSREAKRAASAAWRALDRRDDDNSNDVRALLAKSVARFSTISQR